MWNSKLEKRTFNREKEKNAHDLKVTTQNKEFSDLKNKSHEYGQRITDLEDEVKEKAKTVKVKDVACMNFNIWLLVFNWEVDKARAGGIYSSSGTIIFPRAIFKGMIIPPYGQICTIFNQW